MRLQPGLVMPGGFVPFGGTVLPTALAFDPANKEASITLSNSNRTATLSSTIGFVRSLTSHTSGQWHFECTLVSGSIHVGVIRDTTAATSNTLISSSNSALLAAGGQMWVRQAYLGNIPGGGASDGDVIALEVDLDANLIYFQRQGQSRSAGQDISVNAGVRHVFIGGNGTTGVGTINTGQVAFAVTPTSGYAAWG